MENENLKAIGLRLESMCLVAAAIHSFAEQLMNDSTDEESSLMITAIKELSKGQAREMEAIAGYLNSNPLGYYAAQFGNDDAAVIIANVKEGKAA